MSVVDNQTFCQKCLLHVEFICNNALLRGNGGIHWGQILKYY